MQPRAAIGVATLGVDEPELRHQLSVVVRALDGGRRCHA